MVTKKCKLHIDTDIGCDVDDLCAMVYMLKKKDVELVGITTTLEQNGRRTRYVNHLLRQMGLDGIPVGAGADCGFDGQPTPNTVFDNESEIFVADVLATPRSTLTAEQVICGSLAQGAVFAAIGTLTNFAHYVCNHGNQFDTSNLFVMGGSYTPPGDGYPNWRQLNDWNFNMDLAAAQFLFANSSFSLVEIAPTLRVFLTERDCKRLEQVDEFGALVASQAYWWRDTVPFIRPAAQEACLPNDLCNFHYDPLTCAIAVGFSGIGSSNLTLQLHLDQELGYRLTTCDGTANIRLIHTVDATAFHHDFMNTMLEQHKTGNHA